MTFHRALLTLFLLLVTGPSSRLAAADRLRVSYSALNASQSYLWVAQERRFYSKHGLEVELLYINSGSMNVAALVGGISRFGSSTDQGFRYLFRKAGLSVERDLKLLQLGGDASRLAALQVNKVQYTFLGAAATEQARAIGLRVLATAQQMGIPFPWTSVVVDEPWLGANREMAYRYVKALTEALWFMKRNRTESERIIAKYMRLNDPKLVTMEYNFNTALFPDLPAPTLEGVRLILENFGAENPEAARRDPREFVDSSIIDRLRHEQFLESLGK